MIVIKVTELPLTRVFLFERGPRKVATVGREPRHRLRRKQDDFTRFQIGEM